MNRLHGWRAITGALLVGLWWSAPPAVAHHSYAMFDPRVVALTGTVKEFQWTNPHVWILLTVSDEKGQPVEWGIETGSPNMLKTRGWKVKSVVAGDKIVAEVHPKRDGSNQGSLIQLTKSDGTVLRDRDLVTMPIGEPPQSGG